jgi:putative ABC transport system permease protein
VLRSGLRKLSLGLLCGLFLALLLTRSMSALLFGVSPWDAQIFLLAAAALAATGVLACIFPALRATRLDPPAAIRLD